MRVAFMGTPDFSVPTLKALEKAGHEIVAVITQPDRPFGRGKKLRPSPVKEAALELGLPVFQPEKIREPLEIEKFLGLAPDVAVVVAFGQILPKEILFSPTYGCVNVHASLLPSYRGAAPIHRAVINGDKKTGITTMLMNEGLDTGDMLLQEEIDIGIKDTTGDIHDHLARIGADLLIATLKGLEENKIVPVAQNEEDFTYASKLTSQDEIINWNKSAISIYNQVRGLNPWPCARTFLEGKILKIWEVELGEENVSFSTERPGTVVLVDKKSLWVSTKDSPLKINKLQLQGGKRLEVVDFLRGNAISLGNILG